MKAGFRIMATAGAALAALALAGCGSKDDAGKGEPKSVEEVKQEAAKLEKPEPGEYRQDVQITKFEIPGLPAQAAEQMKAAMETTQKGTFCLTQADADKGFKDMFNNVGKGNQCTYSKFDVDGGTLDAQMECKSPPQGAQQVGTAAIKLNGTVNAKGSDVTVAMDMNGGPPPMGTMKMTMHMVTTRLGDCKGS